MCAILDGKVQHRLYQWESAYQLSQMHCFIGSESVWLGISLDNVPLIYLFQSHSEANTWASSR
jgi:hypothetical protein